MSVSRCPDLSEKNLQDDYYKPFYGINGTMIKEINQSMMTVSHKMENINKEIEIRKKNKGNSGVEK